MTQSTGGPVPALKKWAAVIRTLDHGEQMLLLRKGSIAEPGGEFRVEENESTERKLHTEQPTGNSPAFDG